MRNKELALDDLLAATTVPHRVIRGTEGSLPLRGVRSLSEAGPTDVAYATGKHVASVEGSEAAVIVIDEAAISSIGGAPYFPLKTWIATDRPRLLIAELARPFERLVEPGIHESAHIDRAAVIHPEVAIGPQSAIGADVEIGRGSVIGPNASIQDATIGRNVVVGPGSVIGFAGFGYERAEDGAWLRLPHLGRVVIEDDVEIGANTCIDRGTFGDTVIQSGARIDNLVHIAHNCQIGKNAVVIALSMIGGSAAIGNGAWIAPATSVLNGLEVGSDAMTGMGAVVVKNVSPGDLVVGVPARTLESGG